ncbi:MAG: Holliday junction branch migration protein RuvA [Bacillaceae bacterium]|nr:Holliday junction branch migration protein RuvA [Bacillaceae bacterium]
MIAFIEGKVERIEDESIIVAVSGIGYEIMCANPFQFQRQLHEQVRIYTYHYVREDAQTLYGFKEWEEKELFAKLLNVSGIGPKGALGILSASDVQEIAAAIEREDEKYLTRFPGVGKKTARQMILDLKGKVANWLDVQSQEKASGDTQAHDQNEKMLEEAMEALLALGYTQREVQKILPELRNQPAKSVDDYVRIGLSLMMKSK